ncbi:carboxymuconolactone decarboxylase family protein [Streptomyces sp. ISL-99]|uniref:carboxymuconolactone decarboxylase family protein n=1 Tax=Streptomyces sp. ISL-99 TaxID=2819193 RepID=UPI001BEC7236|nr:carboxymuconolactone decarboxylase family protein [Streptomyces sp. ISL-99]MBT2528672.1 carboxymuconolactone decarboxylase family protein [Streptomyces sp. ISL-99]
MTGPFRYTDPVPPKAATGVTAEVYAQLATDFGIKDATTFVVLSPSPPLLTGAWALLRESLLAGRASRTAKQVVAAGVSLANRCPFCVDAHTVLLHATGDHRLAEVVARGEVPADPGHAALLAWAKATRTGDAGEPPVPAAHAPEFIGTALAFHFINRIVSSLLTENMLPGNAQRYRLVRSLAGRSLSRTVRRRLTPGAGLGLLETSGPEPAWAAGSPAGTAYAGLREAARLGGGLLSDEDQAYVRDAVAASGGAHPRLTGDWLPGREERPGARLALLAAVAPYRITDEDVAAWRGPQHTDHCLVHLIAYGAITATEHIEAALTAHREPA